MRNWSSRRRCGLTFAGRSSSKPWKNMPAGIADSEGFNPMDQPPTFPQPEPAQKIPTTSSKMQTFWRRLISSVILWSMVIGALFTEKLFSDIVFIVVMLLIAGFALEEFYEMCEKRHLVTFKICGLLV